MRCSRCGSVNVNVEMKSGYSYSKGILGELILGTGGAVAGVGGKSKIGQCHCMACGALGDQASIAMDVKTEYVINLALKENDVDKLKYYKSKYKNIEWTPPTPDNTVKSATNNARPTFNDPRFTISAYGTLTKYNALEENVVIPDGVKAIGNRAFNRHVYGGFYSVTIPGSVTSIDNEAFLRENHLESVVFTKSQVDSSAFQYAGIGESAFESCSSLKSISIPQGFKRIGVKAFSSCYDLVSISIPDSVTKIEKEAFSSCHRLCSIVIPNGVTSIEERTFDGCEQLQSISIPNSVTSIGKHAFSFCEKMQSFSIPDSVTSIGECAFSFCYHLQSFSIPPKVTSIHLSTFDQCKRLTTVKIPKSVDSIEDAFRDCKKLKMVYFDDPCGWTRKYKAGTIEEAIDEKILSDPKSAAKYIKKHSAASTFCKIKQ